MERRLVRQEQRRRQQRQPQVRSLPLVLELPQVRLLFWATDDMIMLNVNCEYDDLASIVITKNEIYQIVVDMVAVITLATSFETMHTIKSVSEIPKEDTV
jgi:hypothetical protein